MGSKEVIRAQRLLEMAQGHSSNKHYIDDLEKLKQFIEQAADEIERLRAENETLRNLADGSTFAQYNDKVDATMLDNHRLRAALQEIADGGSGWQQHTARRALEATDDGR